MRNSRNTKISIKDSSVYSEEFGMTGGEEESPTKLSGRWENLPFAVFLLSAEMAFSHQAFEKTGNDDTKIDPAHPQPSPTEE
ncbi:hypothetical protein GR138_18515 [Shinella kummerowiae]|jgi:hypothetical protein|uniref:Uncharacterized protein n=1 Tax=Shinella kummerowiae TaxID=417745 RepID=A0A6N8SDP2_9HYPH|nr:hypothetical protein [Shinella kummerowiae]MXN47194.1 hypothetical protein [Shinella kummerowiae]